MQKLIQKFMITGTLWSLSQCAVAAESSSRAGHAYLRFSNLSSSELRIDQGEVPIGGLWWSKNGGERLPILRIGPGEIATFNNKDGKPQLIEIPCGVRYCLQVKALRSADRMGRSRPGLKEFFASAYDDYLVTIFGHGVVMQVSRKFGESFASRIRSRYKGEQKWVVANLANLAQNVGAIEGSWLDMDASAKQELLAPLAEIVYSERRLEGPDHKVMRALYDRLMDSDKELDEGAITAMRKRGMAALFATGFGYFANRYIEEHGNKWMSDLYKEDSDLVSMIAGSGTVFFNQAGKFYSGFDAVQQATGGLVRSEDLVKIAINGVALKSWLNKNKDPECCCYFKTSEPGRWLNSDPQIVEVVARDGADERSIVIESQNGDIW